MFNDKNAKLAPFSSNLGVNTFGHEFDHLVNRMFDSFWCSPEFLKERNWRPTDISEENDSVSIEIELPGFKKNEVNVQVEQGQIKVSAKNKKSHYVRTFTYGNLIDIDKMDAKLEDGVLLIKIPKSERAKAKVIEVK